ncbi:MAG: menaquinone biosynthesis protein [Pirellulales bacterium]
MTTTNRAALRLGAVNYLNTKPLVYGLGGAGGSCASSPGAYDLSFDLPSRLADDLAAGRLDVALIPSIEFFQNPSYAVVSDACIACRGPVLSVKLFSRVPLESIASLALDEGSRTSAAVVQILLRKRFGLAPALEPLPIGATLADTAADAVLLIGDRAIHSPPGRFAAVWDLGDQWQRWSGLPFVFAMWVARPGIDADRLAELATVLAAARDGGLAHVEEIAEREAPLLGLTIPQCVSYLRDNLHFTLGPLERRGLDLFHRLAAELALVPADSIYANSNADTDADNPNATQRSAVAADCQTAR